MSRQEEDDDATAVKLKSKVQDECDYDEAAVEEERKDASDDETDTEVIDIDNPLEQLDEESEEKEEKIVGLESNEFGQQYRVDKEHHLWCELTFQVI